MTTAWTKQHVERIALDTGAILPVITSAGRSGLLPDLIYWDMWPIQEADGTIARIHGRELWMALTAPNRGDPGLRHFEARVRLIERLGMGWRDHGPVLPEADVPYEREWSGSALVRGSALSLYFTGAGCSDRPGGFQQALFESHARIGANGFPQDWSSPHLALGAAPEFYMSANAHEGEAGKIKAFRDPAWFRDPADGAEYLIFTASLAGSSSAFNGAIGIARRSGDVWQALPPLITADGVNNELERAHIVFHQGRYHAFWATQRSTFSPDLRPAPNGLYGMVADSLFGPYRPLNGSGLVLANPAHEPLQAYSWFVSADLTVSSFIDFWGLDGAPVPTDPALASRYFGGVPAPLLKLAIEGDNCWLASEVAA